MSGDIHYLITRVIVNSEIEDDMDLIEDDMDFILDEVRYCDLLPPSWNDTNDKTEVTCPDCIRIINAPLDMKSWIFYRVLPYIISFFGLC